MRLSESSDTNRNILRVKFLVRRASQGIIVTNYNNRNTHTMYHKFIITNYGALRFGIVYQHRELLEKDEYCPYGGGLWEYDTERNAVLLYGRSFAFGAPSFEEVRYIEWESIGIEPCPLLHVQSRERLLPVCVGVY